MTLGSAGLIVICRFCGEIISLNEDTYEARMNQTDPHQQLRKHLALHPSESIAFVRKIGWLIDCLAFSPAEGSERYRELTLVLAKYFQGEFPGGPSR